MPVQKPGRCATLSFSSPHPRPLVSPQAIVAITIFITFLFVITLWYIVASWSLILNDMADHGSFSTPHTGLMSMHMFTTRPQTCEGLLPLNQDSLLLTTTFVYLCLINFISPVCGSSVMTSPMVGSTWPRVRFTLGSDCLSALFQGTASFRRVVD